MFTIDMLLPQMSRAALEAHLRLQGWVPCSWGSGAARRGTLIVYVHGMSFEDRMQQSGHHILREDELGPGDTYKHDIDEWYQSDKTMAALARAIYERDRSDAA